MSLDTPENQTVEVVQSEKGGVITVEPEFVSYLRSNGYPINGVTRSETLQSESDDEKDYVVYQVETTRYPSGHTDLDIVEDAIEIPVCGCWDYRSNAPDISDAGTTPEDVHRCKHVRACMKTERAKADENQEELL
jgi:hypothetical protein